MDLRVIGVYPVRAPEPAHLVELAVAGCTQPLDVGAITQETPGKTRDYWQVPWDEHFLDASGASVLNKQRPDEPPTLSDFRVVFFFHYLDLEQPLITPAGPLALPSAQERPARLSFLEYETPC